MYHYGMSMRDVLELTPGQAAILMDSLSDLVGPRDG